MKYATLFFACFFGSILGMSNCPSSNGPMHSVSIDGENYIANVLLRTRMGRDHLCRCRATEKLLDDMRSHRSGRRIVSTSLTCLPSNRFCVPLVGMQPSPIEPNIDAVFHVALAIADEERVLSHKDSIKIDFKDTPAEQVLKFFEKTRLFDIKLLHDTVAYDPIPLFSDAGGKNLLSRLRPTHKAFKKKHPDLKSGFEIIEEALKTRKEQDVQNISEDGYIEVWEVAIGKKGKPQTEQEEQAEISPASSSTSETESHP